MRMLLTLLLGCLFLQAKAFQTKPLVLNAHTMVYHEAENQVYIFGGATDSEVTNAMRILGSDGVRELESVGGPSPRTFAAMAYDPKDESILLFGGSKVLFGNGPDPSNILNDTWRFKDGKWIQIETSHQPGVRAEASLVYDHARQRLVLFGGYEIVEKSYTKRSDTWEFYDSNWHQVKSEGPSPRNGAAMIYNPRLKKLMLFGGGTADRNYAAASGETWVFDGEWEKLDIAQPPNVFNANMVYDPNAKDAIRFGGWNGKGRINELWSFKSEEWSKIEISGPQPAPRNHSQMVYDSKNQRALLYGGHDGPNVFGDLWAFSNGKWTQLLMVESRKRVANKH